MNTQSRGVALLAVAVFSLLDATLLGCGSSPVPPSPVEHAFDAGIEAGDEPELDAATDAVEEGAAADGNDAGSTCVVVPPATGAISNDCFPSGTCSWCGIPSGTEYLCSDSAGVGVHPNLAGCLSDNGGMSGWASACCPSTPTCTRLSDDDAFCAGQGLPGSAYACPVVAAKPTATPSAPGCLPSGTTFSASGQPQEPTVPGAALSPAQSNALFCCPIDPGGDQ